MSRSPISVSSLAEIRELESRIRGAAEAAMSGLAARLANGAPLEVMRAMKFRTIGFDPLEPRRNSNVLEQIHQTFAYLTTVRAAAYLLENHPEHAPFTLTFGNSGGPDVLSGDGEVAAETVAAWTTVDNNKIAFDLQRMRERTARYRYLFYHTEDPAGAVGDPEVRVVSLDLR